MHTLARWQCESEALRHKIEKKKSLFFQLAIETAANEQGYPTSPVAKRLIGTLKV